MKPRALAPLSLSAFLALPLLLASGSPARSQPADASGVRPSDGPSAAVEDDARVAPAVARGLASLAAMQDAGGAFPDGQGGRSAGITGIAGLAFLADGHLPGRTGYGFVVDQAAAFLIASSGPSGLIAADTSHGPMYGHGYATLFLAELLGELGRAPAGGVTEAQVRATLVRAVRLTVETQNPEGGWRYQPRPLDADISVTITQVMGLRAARNAGVAVPLETIERAIEYVKNCQQPGPVADGGGGFRYMTSPGSSQWERSAAGVASLQHAGIYGGEAVERGLAYLALAGPGGDRFRGSAAHPFYGHYYHAQAAFLAGGEHWAGYFPRTREELLGDQLENGAWASRHGDAYGTGMALLVLQMPNRLLPIFQR